MSNQQQAETAFCSAQLGASVEQPNKLSQLQTLQAQVRKMSRSGDQTPSFWEERNTVERDLNKLWNEVYGGLPGRQA